MGEINRLSNVTPINPTSSQDRLDEKNMKRRVLKEHMKEVRMEESLENRREDENYFNEITAKEFFSNGSGANLLESTREIIPPSSLELYETNLLKETIMNKGRTTSDLVDDVYVSGEEIEAFFEFMDPDGKKKIKYIELTEKLIAAREGEEESLIDNAAKTVCAGNKADIYLMLCYLYEDLIKRNAKKSLQDRLRKIIDAFGRQESAYLFSFFSFENILKTSPNSSITASMLDKMANISSGNLKLNSLRQSLQFIVQTLPDSEMYKMVSIFMKFQAKGLKRITTLNEGREGKEELANILQQERNLIILNSLYNQSKKVFNHVKKVTPIEEKYGDFMGQVINVIESSVVSLDGLQNMQKTIGVKQLTLETNRVFIKNFLVLLNQMPQPIFYNETMRDKLLESIKNIMNAIEKMMQPVSSGLSFLRTKSNKKSRS